MPPDASDSTIAQLALLARRVEREHKARLAAEVLAEQGLRELYQAQQELRLLVSIADTANHASSITETLRFAVTSICNHTGWEVGHVYLNHQLPAPSPLRSARIWNDNLAPAFAELRDFIEQRRLVANDGWPGRVLAARQPLWIRDLAAERDADCWELRAAGQLRATFAFPVIIGEEVVALLEFSCTRVQDEDASLLSLLSKVGVQLGRAVERKISQDKLLYDATHDALTGLPNRQHFRQLLTQALLQAQQRNTQCAVLFIDLDHFKLVNDSMGHHAGDQLIIHVAQRVRSTLQRLEPIRHPDQYAQTLCGGAVVARLGGDEFTVLLENVTTESVPLQAAEQILELLKQPFLINGQEVYSGASIGIALSAPGYYSGDEILRDADLAMYQAKSRGKSRGKVFDRGMRDQAAKRLTIESDLRRALPRQEFLLNYQPIVALDNGEIIGFEALIRWRRAGVIVPPADFIPIADELGLIIPIGHWVLEEACRTLRDWQQHFPRQQPLTISVNVSPRQFRQPNFVSQVRQALHNAGIEPGALTLEITESATMGNPERAIATLLQLRDLGVKLSIDDFGTGYSSLSYLHRFPLHALKIDRSFIARIDGSFQSFQVVHSIMSLANNLGIAVVAEGIETIEQVGHLRALLCQFGQGYHFSRPLPQADVLQLLTRPVLCLTR
ncbi:MAG: EAL domain-containing protein [Acidobacteriaceae bacterium]|nr:EAL domain-containing protein [Acidobacteriaceae bacterium]